MAGRYADTKVRKNDHERELWVNNDEWLYNWYSCSRLSMRAFIRANRAEIDAVIEGVVNAKPAVRGWR